MTIQLHIHKAYLSGLIAAISMLGDTIIPLFAPAEHLGWWRWKIALVLCSVIAIIALSVQMLVLSRQEHERENKEKQREKKERERDEQIREILESTRVGRTSTPVKSDLPAHLDSDKTKGTEAFFDGELQRIFVYPRIGFAYPLLKEIWRQKHSKNPKVDVDVIAAIYIVNTSPSQTYYILEITASVEVDGVRRQLERQTDFRLDRPEAVNEVEYGLECDDKDEPEPLEPLLASSPYELRPLAPIKGWIRYLLKDGDPEAIDDKTWQFSIVDSLGKSHPITKTSDKPKAGELGFRRYQSH